MKQPASPALAPAVDEPSHLVQLLIPAGGLLALASCMSVAQAVTTVNASNAAERFADAVRFGAVLVVAVWMAWVLAGRMPHILPRQRLVYRLLVALGGTAFVYTTTPSSSVLAMNLGTAVYGCTLAWLAIEVCRKHGCPTRPGFRVANVEQRAQTWRVTSWAFLICLAGAVLGSSIEQALRYVGLEGAWAVGLDQRAALNADDPAAVALKFVATVAIEEIVIVAATATLLAAARRPAWQIYSSICLIEALLHAYMGLAAVAMAAFAAGHVWLYRRYGTFLPLVIGHATYNLGYVLPKWFAPAPYATVASLFLVLATVAGVAQRSPARTRTT
ncbi:CPBP family glutamic-type intramembrane protease [Streptomyces sp. SP18BB07]|uniref:CPBP family glutamic-type intramembrane protease n=1 Tax=Streptomyces sp. SP18BB07 TaxID=3002522 RepID=UPI002E767CA0|nr:CPBP family glutamic-type intramembrane protease [Streptomyces sp. SP18BB07]MEE1764395.1 hypothetical protein [Streptomyces sp. SP18BB07]